MTDQPSARPSRRPGQPKPAKASPPRPLSAKAASTFTPCQLCPMRDACSFEERCDDACRHGGRNTLYSDALAAALIEHVAGGGSIKKWCLLDGHPNYKTIRNWALARPDFSTSLARAQEAYTHSLVTDAVDIVDDAKVEDISKAREQAAVRLRVAAMINPARFGQKVEMTVQDNRPSLAEIDAKLTSLLAKAATDAPAGN